MTGRAARQRAALALWTMFALVVWNVVFDHVIVVAGREFIAAATAAALKGGPYINLQAWMRPAAERAFLVATASAATVLVVGVAGVRLAAGRGGMRA